MDLLDADDLRRLAAAAPQAPCALCAPLKCPGWEAVPGSFDRRRLRALGTLRRADEDEPTLEEFRPGGIAVYDPGAPIAPRFYPYNRCDVCACTGCGRLFLRYTEAGGYYHEERIRELDAAKVAG